MDHKEENNEAGGGGGGACCSRLCFCCGIIWDKICRILCCTCYDYEALSYEQYRTAYRIRKTFGFMSVLLGVAMLSLTMIHLYFDEEQLHLFTLLSLILGIVFVFAGTCCCFETSYDWEVLSSCPRFAFNPPSYVERQARGWPSRMELLSDFESDRISVDVELTSESEGVPRPDLTASVQSELESHESTGSKPVRRGLELEGAATFLGNMETYAESARNESSGTFENPTPGGTKSDLNNSKLDWDESPRKKRKRKKSKTPTKRYKR